MHVLCEIVEFPLQFLPEEPPAHFLAPAVHNDDRGRVSRHRVTDAGEGVPFAAHRPGAEVSDVGVGVLLPARVVLLDTQGLASQGDEFGQPDLGAVLRLVPLDGLAELLDDEAAGFHRETAGGLDYFVLVHFNNSSRVNIKNSEIGNARKASPAT